MNQRPRGRDRNVSGTGKDVFKRGSGLGTGPVGHSGGYSGRGAGQGGGGNRSTRGGGSLITIILLVVALLGGGGFGLSNLFGSSGSVFSGSGWTGTASSTAADWVMTPNTNDLKTGVDSAARAKYTHLSGGGNDTVTMMVYLCGTDLESKNGMATADLNEMLAANLSDKINLIVYTGGCKKWKNNTVSNSVNQIYQIKNKKLNVLVGDDGKGAMTDPATLTRFIRYCKTNFPADRNLLIFWDHGGGSLSGFGYDERNASSGSMDLKEIDTALKDGGVKFDFVGFDACLMATYENALMLEKHADYLIASEETEPGVGWYYTNWLNQFSKNTSLPTIEVGKMIADDFVSFCEQKCPGQKTTLSVVDLGELKASTPDAFSDFAEKTASLVQGDDFQKVSDARAGTREFAVSSKIDQVDLVHFVYNLKENDAGQKLLSAVLGAVKYNRTGNMTNAYGLSIYFPYRGAKTKVTSAINTYEAIGMDESYTKCIRSFASLETAGQSVAGAQSPLSGLLGNFTGAGAESSSSVSSLFSSLLSSGSLFGRDLDPKRASDFLTGHQFETENLVWVEGDDGYVMRLSDEQWSLVQELELNVFYDDGEGYIDLGLDNVFEFNENGELIGEYDNAWIAIDSQPVPYYHESSFDDGKNYVITGRVPVLLNGERAELVLTFDNDHPKGVITGARWIYKNGETETAAKELTGLAPGDRIEYICDYYSYSGAYQDSFLFGEEWTYHEDYKISDVYLPHPENAKAAYLFTDLYHQEYWSSAIPD